MSVYSVMHVVVSISERYYHSGEAEGEKDFQRYRGAMCKEFGAGDMEPKRHTKYVSFSGFPRHT